MRYRALGTGGAPVSEVGFGTGDNGGLLVRASEYERQAAVERALDLGITYFDTAPDYGKGLAETNLGLALRSRRSEAVIATKVEIMPDAFDDIEGAITRSLDASLKRLGTDAVDVLMMHNPPRFAHDPDAPAWTPLTPEEFTGPVRRGLERARAAGKARYFGFAAEFGERAAVKALLETGLFHAVNVRYSLVDSDDDIIAYAAKHGVGVAVIRVLAGGALTSQVAREGIAGRHALAGGRYSRRPETFQSEIDRGRAFAFLENGQRTLAQAAYIFALMNPAVSTVLGGYSAIEHIEELAATSGAEPLTTGEMNAIHRENYDVSSAR